MLLTPGHNIEVSDTGSRFDCRPYETLLSAMGRVGAKGIPVGCRSGGCGVCKIHIQQGDYVTGKMSRAHVTEEEEEQGYALACRCHPRSDLTIQVVGKMHQSTVHLPQGNLQQNSEES